ncbi:RNA polymerase subunit sigma-70 [Fodinicola acaciae]|uniref:RNA polymerase subunit sigma-70 n=1 Tax=Fodinicola acaciae TaxID=2681555 RepID=UPI001C9E53FA|nr:RNA polymerase subunit sigma-70 [Fodinicola acaciae]
MTNDLLLRARRGDGDAFGQLVEPYRRELHAHCYRILGSVQDAEDVLQETLTAAWRGLDRFEGRASVRTWLYRIATNRCLNFLRDSRRRPATVDERPPFQIPEPSRLTEPNWVEPYPSDLPDSSAGPEASYESSETISLAFVTALQNLPPRQRAALVLCDVMGFRAAEAADMLEVTETAVSSALKRARSAIPERRDGTPLPDAAERAIADRFAAAYERGDIAEIVELLTTDVRFTMPPSPLEYLGMAAVAAFLAAGFEARQGLSYRLVPTRANGQPAFGCYAQDRHTSIARAHGLVVLSVDDRGIAEITRFADNATIGRFGLPRTL